MKPRLREYLLEAWGRDVAGRYHSFDIVGKRQNRS